MLKQGIRLCLVAALVLQVSNPLYAATERPNPRELIDQKQIEDVHDWLLTEIIFHSIEQSNKRRKDITAEEILAIERQWVEEALADVQPLITAALNTPASNYVTKIQAAAGGLYHEIIIMDQIGLNVGQSSMTTDYWQGDENKFRKTYKVGAGSVHIEGPVYDNGTHTWRAQLSMTIVGASENTPIGAATIEFNLTELQRRRAHKGK